MTSFSLSSLPAELTWTVPPRDLCVDPAENRLSIAAGGRTDLFISPRGDSVKLDAPQALFAVPAGDFLFSARVTVEFASTFDAGALLLYAEERLWGKLCFEYSPQREPMVVSVVTRQWSDDCNSVTIGGNRVYLRVGRKGRALIFHFSEDGRLWHLVRHFTLGDVPELKAGFCAQSPTGAGSAAVFSDIRFEQKTLEDIRDGR